MYTPQFDYRRAKSVAEAISLLGQNAEAKVLAGGHSLLPAMKLRLSAPAMLVDIGHLSELKKISVSGNALTIGALCTHAQIAASADVKTHCAALAAACGQVGDPAVRNWGTLGGNLAHADPASDPPTVALAAGAQLYIQGPKGTRTVNADRYFTDLFKVDLQAGELLTAIEIPSQRSAKSAYAKMAHPASRYAVVGVCVFLEMDGGTCKRASVAVGGATPKATRSGGAEKALTGSKLDDKALEAAATALAKDIGDGGMGDIYASAEYRRAMAGVYLKRAVKAALA